MIQLSKIDYKVVLLVISSILLICGLVYLFTPKPQIPSDLKNSINELVVANKKLIESQNHLDSAITVYESKIEIIDSQINGIKGKTIIINKYYNNLSQQIDHFQPNQIDSFFKQRYNY
jgi:hypothetical protein